MDLRMFGFYSHKNSLTFDQSMIFSLQNLTLEFKFKKNQNNFDLG